MSEYDLATMIQTRDTISITWYRESTQGEERVGCGYGAELEKEKLSCEIISDTKAARRKSVYR